TTAIHRKSPTRCGRGQNRLLKLASSPALNSLQLGRQFTDQAFDLLGLMPVTNQNRVACSHDDEIVDPEQRDRGSLLIENNVVGGIERGDGTVRRIPVLVVFEIIGNRSPAA